MIKLLFYTLSIYLCIRILKNQNYGIGINHSQRHFFYYHTSTPIGSLPVRSRQLLRTMFSSFSTILRLFSLEAFQRRRASSLVNICSIQIFFLLFILVQPIYSSSTFSHQNYTYSSKPPRKSQEICKLSANNHKINRKL